MFLARPWIWEQLAPAKHVLVFQADSMICSNSLRNIESFFKWDLLGAWVRPQVYNGGLSLRNRTMLLEVLAEWMWEEDVSSGRSSALGRGGRLTLAPLRAAQRLPPGRG
jgi:hypothetical protein